MTIDPLSQQLTIGGAVAVALVATVMKFLPAFMSALKAQKDSSNGKLSEFEKIQIAEIVRMGNEAHLADMRRLMENRENVFREIVRDELRERGVFIRSEHPGPYTGEERRRK